MDEKLLHVIVARSCCVLAMFIMVFQTGFRLVTGRLIGYRSTCIVFLVRVYGFTAETFCFSVPFSMRKTCARRAEVGVPVYLYLSGLYLSIDLSIYLSIYLSILSICICVCVCLYIYMYMCVCVCMCIYIYIECPKGVGSNGTCNMQHDPSLIIKAPTVDDIDPASPIIRNIPEFP